MFKNNCKSNGYIIFKLSDTLSIQNKHSILLFYCILTQLVTYKDTF